MADFQTWVGKISEDFTFKKVREITEEIARQLRPNEVIIVGYDARFLGERFAEEVVKELEKKKLNCYLTESDTPTPVIAWEVEEKKAAGGIIVTAGSMPFNYSGIKFIRGSGSKASAVKFEKVERFNPQERYLKYLEAMVDASLIKRAKLRVMVDVLYGSARDYLGKLLPRLGCQVEEIHDHRDVLFGGLVPKSTEENLKELKTRVKEFHLGFAFNADASEFAYFDQAGNFYPGKVKKDAFWDSLQIIENFAQAANMI